MTASHSRSVALKPSAGEPVGQVLNSQGSVRVLGVFEEEPRPDWFTAGAERTTYMRILAPL